MTECPVQTLREQTDMYTGRGGREHVRPERVCAQLNKFEEGETYAGGSGARATCPHLNLSSDMENAICCSLLTCSNGTHCGLFLSCQVLRRENVWLHSTRDLCRVRERVPCAQHACAGVWVCAQRAPWRPMTRVVAAMGVARTGSRGSVGREYPHISQQPWFILSQALHSGQLDNLAL